MIFLLVAALFLHLTACSAGDPCPPKAHLAPCTCSQIPVNTLPVRQHIQLFVTTATIEVPTTSPTRILPVTTESPTFGNDSLYTIVNCKVSKSIRALEEIISSALNRKLVDKLVVANVPPVKQHHTLARLPSGWLKEVRVRNFQVLDSKLYGDFIWYGNPFEGQEKSLLWFAANNCLLTGSLTFNTPGTVNTKGLDSLPFIQGLDLSNNFLTVITSTSFSNPPTNLSTVILSRNSIQYIDTGTFFTTPFLRYVDLSHNLLESVMRHIFASPAKNLEYIDLSWNSLKALREDFFVDMPALKRVNVSNNFLYSMPGKPWSRVWRQLTHIDVTGNFIDCNCDLMWLLPILSPPEVNVTTTPAPKPLPGQTVLGTCIKTTQPRLFTTKYELVTVTRDRLAC